MALIRECEIYGKIANYWAIESAKADYVNNVTELTFRLYWDKKNKKEEGGKPIPKVEIVTINGIDLIRDTQYVEAKKKNDYFSVAGDDL